MTETGTEVTEGELQAGGFLSVTINEDARFQRIDQSQVQKLTNFSSIGRRKLRKNNETSSDKWNTLPKIWKSFGREVEWTLFYTLFWMSTLCQKTNKYHFKHLHIIGNRIIFKLSTLREHQRYKMIVEENFPKIRHNPIKY